MEMESQQQENEEELTDDYRPATNGTDTTASIENDENGIKTSGANDMTTSTAATTNIQQNWSHSKCIVYKTTLHILILNYCFVY